MGQIVIVLKDKELSTILRSKITQKYGADVIIKDSATEAISILEILPDIGIILCDQAVDKIPTSKKISDYLMEKEQDDPRDVKLVVLGKGAVTYPKSVMIPETMSSDKIVAFIGFLLGKEEENVLLVAELSERKKAEQERAAEEKAEKERLEQERINKIEREKAAERAEIERIEKKKAIEERIARGNARAKKLAQEKAEKEKLEREKAEKEKNAQLTKAEQEKAEREKAEREKLEREKAAIEKRERARLEKEKLEKEKQEAARLAMQKAAAIKAAAEKAAKEKIEEEQDDEEGSTSKTTVFVLPKNFRMADPAPEQAEQPVKTESSGYRAFNIIYFMNLADLSVDFSVYSRVKKGDGFEYSLKIKPNTKIIRTDIERILVRSGKDLYVENEVADKVSAFLNSHFIARFKVLDLSWGDRMKINSEGYEILLDLFKSSAFDKYNLEIVKELIKSMDMLAKAPDAVKVYLEAQSSRKLSYGYVHANMTLYLLFQIVDLFAWGKDQSKNKLLYLSLFHDLNLTSDRLIRLHHNFQEESKNLKEEERQIMLGHADDTAIVLENIVKAPRELTAMIREHHGLKSGKGFIDSLSLAITPTSMAFIVVEAFVTQYLAALEKVEGDKTQGPSKEQLQNIILELKKKFDRLTYAEVLAQVQKLFAIA